MIVNPIYKVIFNTQSDLSDFSYQTGVSNPWLPVVVALKKPDPSTVNKILNIGEIPFLAREIQNPPVC
ncbi:hypothetical protein [Anabaena sp. CS-542/02]|uniref:hypothetical protein n=1 Tax=Anabaena sp. CS-542/02 TaxID=3021719 RepID=UPI00232C6D4E|nr:hypothetical protein [Anabaena sp. CS-542/02]